MKIKIQIQESLPSCCGVEDVGGFVEDHYGFDHDVLCSGTGLFVSTFINTPVCRQAYKDLKKQHKLLYQSKPYKNNGSGRKVFLCVFLHKEVKK